MLLVVILMWNFQWFARINNLIKREDSTFHGQISFGTMEVTIRNDVSGIIATHKMRICDSVVNVKDWTPFTTVKPDNLSEVSSGTNLWSTANAHRTTIRSFIRPLRCLGEANRTLVFETAAVTAAVAEVVAYAMNKQAAICKRSR